MFETGCEQVSNLSATCRKHVRDMLTLIKCEKKLCDPSTMRAIPERFCDGVGWWLGGPAVSVPDSGSKEHGFESQSRRCRVAVLGKLVTPIVPRSTQPCIPSGPLNRVPASAGVKAGKSPLLGGR